MSPPNLRNLITRGQSVAAVLLYLQILEFATGIRPNFPVYSKFPSWGTLKAFVV